MENQTRRRRSRVISLISTIRPLLACKLVCTDERQARVVTLYRKDQHMRLARLSPITQLKESIGNTLSIVGPIGYGLYSSSRRISRQSSAAGCDADRRLQRRGD